MSFPDFLFVASVVAVAVFAWAGFFIYIPAAIRSITRYRLWRLRDAIAADGRAGLLSTEATDFLVLHVEGSIRFARALRPWFILPIVIGTRRETVEFPDLSRVTAGERERFDYYCNQIGSITLRQTLFVPRPRISFRLGLCRCMRNGGA